MGVGPSRHGCFAASICQGFFVLRAIKLRGQRTEVEYVPFVGKFFDKPPVDGQESYWESHLRVVAMKREVRRVRKPSAPREAAASAPAGARTKAAPPPEESIVFGLRSTRQW